MTLDELRKLARECFARAEERTPKPKPIRTMRELADAHRST